MRDLESVRVDSVADCTLRDAESGEIEVTTKPPITTRDDLSMAYARVGMGLRRA